LDHLAAGQEIRFEVGAVGASDNRIARLGTARDYGAANFQSRIASQLATQGGDSQDAAVTRILELSRLIKNRALLISRVMEIVEKNHDIIVCAT
jgi:hypothetical protein